ncbi:hypothetical protein [Desulfotalea psychrophila]|nr:hypothetical protein [Desulfotalea psychrophila]
MGSSFPDAYSVCSVLRAVFFPLIIALTLYLLNRRTGNLRNSALLNLMGGLTFLSVRVLLAKFGIILMLDLFSVLPIVVGQRPVLFPAQTLSDLRHFSSSNQLETSLAYFG